MKKVLLVGLVALLGLVVASPSLASGGRPGHAQAHIAKKCKKKHGKKKKCKKKKPVVTVPAPAPTPKLLTREEVIEQVTTRAAVYCADDPACVDYGYYFTMTGGPSDPACETKGTWSWSCYGWNDENTDADPEPDVTCDFREVVERAGIDGVTSHQDLSFGAEDGFDCFAIT
jgi:hypothetical protein